MPDHLHQSLRRIKVEGTKPEGTEWYECKCGAQILMQVICQIPQRAEEAEALRAGVRIERSFVALDESLYETLNEARARNRLVMEVEELSQFLVPRSSSLEHGDGYIQQDPIKLDELRAQMLKLAAKEFKKTINERTRLETLLEEGYDEADADHPLFQLYSRMKCIDRDSREWQTRGLAEDPSAGKQVRLNPEPEAVHDADGG
jgi:hypothetical protein